MNVFISWSGDLSREVAIELRDWLPSVLQFAKPYVSSQDIDKGDRWAADIAKQLEESEYGILCVTKSNITAPWLNFEAGALSKYVDGSRVSPLLIGIERDAVGGPIRQFQSVIVSKEEVCKLVSSINNKAESGKTLESGRLNKSFEKWWPDLEKKLQAFSRRGETEISKDAVAQAAGVQVTEPGSNDSVPSSGFKVAGTYIEIPDGFELWTLTMDESKDRIRYWPQNAARFTGKTWNSRINGLGGPREKPKKFCLFLVGKSGQALIKYFRKAARHTDKNGNQMWHAFEELTEDFHKCQVVEVFVD